jgi:hypothetical protein
MSNYLNRRDRLKWCYRIVEKEVSEYSFLSIIIMSDTKLKTREPLTTRQRSILVTFYNQNPYPSASERHQLVQLTGRTSKQIQDWFANRRVSQSIHYFSFNHFHSFPSVLIQNLSLLNQLLLHNLHFHHLQQ